MTSGFTHEYFKSLIDDDKNLTAKGLLVTKQRIPGIGNGVIQDILWEAGIEPRFKITNASGDDIAAIYNATVAVVKEMCEMGGRDTECDIFGNPGGYVTKLNRNTCGNACPKCRSEIKRTTYMGGNVYFCEVCQKNNICIAL